MASASSSVDTSSKRILFGISRDEKEQADESHYLDMGVNFWREILVVLWLRSMVVKKIRACAVVSTPESRPDSVGSRGQWPLSAGL